MKTAKAPARAHPKATKKNIKAAPSAKKNLARPAAQAAKPAKSPSKFGKLASLMGLGGKKAPTATKPAPKTVAAKPTKGKASAPKKAAVAPSPAKKAAPTTSKAAPAQAVVAAPAKAAKGGRKKQVLSAPQLALQSATANIRASRNGGARPREESAEVCREVACEGLSTTAGYCRLHYIKNWKKIKRKEVILKEGKLNQYIEELVVKYPDKYIEAIRQDLASDKDFAKVIYDLDLDEGTDEFDPEGESMDAVIDTIKRDFDDEGDTGF
jgi:hypothetical protein